MEMHEIERWIKEQDEKNKDADILYYLEHDNGESYSDHWTSVGEYYFKTVKEAFDYAMAKGNVTPDVNTSYATKDSELVFYTKEKSFGDMFYDEDSYTTLKILKPFYTANEVTERQ